MKYLFHFFIAAMILSFPVNAQWKIIDTIDHANYINIHFWDANNGIISGQIQGSFLKTNNGGLSWDTVKVPFIKSSTDNLTAMHFVNNKIGFVCGGSGFTSASAMLIRTTDGGLSWDSLAFNVPGALEFIGLYFNQTGLQIRGIVFDYSSVFLTLDSGKSLSRVTMPVPNLSIHDAVLRNNTIILAGSTAGSGTNQIYTSSNWGFTWSVVFSDTIAIASLGISGSVVIAGCGYGRILRSIDGGNSWTRTTVISSNEIFSKVKFGINGFAYLLGNTHVYGSDNNGLTWHNMQVDTPYNALKDISMPSKDTGYIISNRRLYKTINGGGLALEISNPYTSKDEIAIYPNPANKQLYLKIPDYIKVNTVILYDGAGRVVKELKANWQEIDVSAFARGVYILEINTDKYISKKKLLIQ
ncbi:MAG: T9SS type A sorting domain-containing protein [Taibaiella sp.]|nr:T9SS type A sorting domain-containing protein [Taibaiella sp.]